MAWDIYGNRLTPGYCEVHPHVPEEYPCYLCCRDIDNENQRQNESYLAEKAYHEHMDNMEREHQEDNELTIIRDRIPMINKFFTIQ